MPEATTKQRGFLIKLLQNVNVDDLNIREASMLIGVLTSVQAKKNDENGAGQ